MSKTSSLTITLNSQNVANNTSNITVKGIIKCDSGSYRTGKTLTYWIKANGSYVSNNMPISTTASAKASTTNTMFTWTGNISHNSSGKCTVTAHFNFYSGWVEEDASKTLTAIPQSATLTSVTDTVAGGACACKFTPKSTVYKYKITFSCGGVTVTSPEITPLSTSETTYNFDMPVSTWHPAIPNSKTGTVTATLKTYNGSTQIGSASSKTFTLTANSNSSYLPSISSVSYAINNGYNNNYYLQNKSSVTVTPSASMGSEPSEPSNRGATIAKYTIKVGDTEYTTTSSSITSNILTVAGEYAIVVTATDTRGNVSAAHSGTINVLAYEPPEITGSVFRSDSNGNPAPTTGDCIRLQLGENHTNIGNNSVTWQSISYVKGDSSTSIAVPTSQIPVTLTLDGNTGFSASDKYVFTVVIQDSVGTSKTAIFTVPSAFMLLHFNKNGHGMAIGGGNTVDRTIQSHLPLRAKYGITYDNEGKVNSWTSNSETHAVNPKRLISANLPSTGVAGMNHFLATSDMSTGKPPTDGHIIHLSWDSNNNYNAQLFVPNNNNAAGKIAFRGQGGVSDWSGRNWITVLDENNWSNYITIPKSKYVSGDKFEIVDGDSLGLQIPGIVTTSTQLVHVELHMPYSMENVTPSITALKGYIRGISGYLDNTSSTNQNYITSSSVTVTCAKITNYILRINITKTGNGTWSNTTNNTPVSLQANSITINFT